MTLANLVVSHLHTSSEFRQNHHLYVFVFQENGIVSLVFLFVGYRFYYRIRIDNAAAALIYAFLKEYRIFLSFAYFISRYDNLFFPSFYHYCIYYLSVSSFSIFSKVFPFVSGSTLMK